MTNEKFEKLKKILSDKVGFAFRDSSGTVLWSNHYLCSYHDTGLLEILVEHEIFGPFVTHGDLNKDSSSDVICVGFSDKNIKWWGWSHRATYGFEVGYVAKEGDSCTTSGYTYSYLEQHPEKDISVPVGFECKTTDDCFRCACAFAESVS